MNLHMAMTPRHVAWRQHYRERRYARHLSTIELNGRIRDIFLNIIVLTNEGRVGVLAPKRGDEIWPEKFTHMLEEMALRYGPYPAGMDRDVLHSEPFPDFASDLARKASTRLSALRLRRNEVFIKYGKRRYMEELHTAGRLRIQPASFFSQLDHNGAIRDDELTFAISLALSRDEIVKVVQNPHDVPPDAQDQRVDFRVRHPTDFWIYCLTKSIQPRLFVDFAADCCVIIRHRDAFRYRLMGAAQEAMPNTEMKEGEIEYIDPLLPSPRPPFVPFAKKFGYTYQAEYRFCWMPLVAIQKLEHIDIELGSLADIAELITLD